MPEPRIPGGPERGLRLILASRALDRAYARLDRLRSTLILAFAPDPVLDLFNEWTYGRAGTYEPGSSQFRRELFPWEEGVIDHVFPPPPARVLVGGAGSGREAFQLASRGFEVVAFEPAGALAEAMAAEARAQGTPVASYRGGYEDLPRLTSVANGSVVDLDSLGPFDAGILGWGSFSHVRTRARRIATLAAFARVTRGPILASFLALKPEAATAQRRRLSQRLLARHGREPGDRFSMFTGYQHPTNRSELESLAAATGLEVLRLDLEGADTLAPHVVFAPRGA